MKGIARMIGTGTKGQTWSTDAIIAVVIFVVVFMAFMYITGRSSESKKIDIFTEDASKIPGLFAQSKNNSFTFVEGNKINKEKLENLTNLTYQQLKSELGIKSDFCIHFEDENGNVVFINETAGLAGLGRCGG